jgi:hypothetical protein
MMLSVYVCVCVCVLNTTRTFWGVKETEIRSTDFLRVQLLSYGYKYKTDALF